MTVDSLGLKFKKCNNFTDAVQEVDNNTYRLLELNELNLKFVMAISLKHQETELPVVVAIFEEYKNTESFQDKVNRMPLG